MLHYNPRHVSSSILLIFRRTNCIITASGIVTLCIQPYSMQVESGLQSALNGILYGCLQRVTIPEAVIIQSVLLKMSKVLLETCRGNGTYIQGVPGGKDLTSGECSLGQTIPI